MEEIARPFVWVWDYAERTGGFPGQVFLVVCVVMLIFGILTYLGNKK